ncbi:MAG: nucleotidyltransferase family protein [Desulfatirhabdiaceae bacterium]
MKALLLAAGLGTRLRPITDNIPKCLIDIHGRPLLDYWITLLVNGGIWPILINLHHHADKVVEFIHSCPFRDRIATCYEEKLLGTGGTLRQNRHFFESEKKEPFMLIHADNLSLFDVKAFQNSHSNRPDGCEMTMMTFTSPTPHSCGIIEKDLQGRVLAFHEKVINPPGDLANGAVYIVEPTLFEYLDTINRDFIDFSTDVIASYTGRIFTFHNNIYHRDIGTLESYRAAWQEYPDIEEKNQELFEKDVEKSFYE